MKHKPTYRPGLSREQIDAYRTASEAEKRQTEGSLGSFEQDALDGWEESGLGTSAMQRLDKRFRLRRPRTMLISAAIVVVAAAAAALLLNVPEDPQPSPGKVALSVEQTDAVMNEAIDTLEELPVTEQIRVTTIRSSQQQIKEQQQTAPVTTIEELPAVKPLEPLKPEPAIVAEKKTNQRAAKEIYRHDLKLIDYREYREKPQIEIEKIILTGTSANYEVKDDMQVEPSVETVAIPYIDYIDKTMSYVSRGKWKQSLQRLKLVLETYPDDINGHFYAGLCCYNLQQFGEAKEHFSACLRFSFSNFNEEATWYLAQSLLANGEKGRARELLTTIRDQKGFYAKQAAQLLKGL